VEGMLAAAVATRAWLPTDQGSAIWRRPSRITRAPSEFDTSTAAASSWDHFSRFCSHERH